MNTSHVTLKSYRSPGIVGGSAATQVGGVQFNRLFAKLIDLSICNTSAVALTATAYIKDSTGTAHNLVFNAPIQVGATLIISGPADRYTVLQAGDSIYASITGAGGTADVLLSVEERSE